MEEFQNSVCDECGDSLPHGEVLKWGGVDVCVECKEKLLRKAHDGAFVGQGIWRDRAVVVVEDGEELPEWCIRCGASGEVRETQSVAVRSRFWEAAAILIIICGGWIGRIESISESIGPPIQLVSIFLFLAIGIRLSVGARKRLRYSLCRQHAAAKQRIDIRFWYGVRICFIFALLLFFIGFAFPAPAWLLLTLAGVSVVAFFWGALGAMGSDQISLLKIDRKKYGIEGAGAEFLDRLPVWKPMS